MIMHRTNPHWEAGAIPGKDLLGRVGGLLGELATQGQLLAAEGLRPSSEGVRLRFHDTQRTVVPGPFEPENELPAGFSILRAESIDAAIEWATRLAGITGDREIDIRPVTESWDVGLTEKPANITSRRYMILRKATEASEAGASLSAEAGTKLASLIGAARPAASHIVTETLQPSRRGRRYRNTKDGVSYFDGPFIETKELIAGYVIVFADSLADASSVAVRYIEAVSAEEVDVREVDGRA
jgi:hypothetical protein